MLGSLCLLKQPPPNSRVGPKSLMGFSERKRGIQVAAFSSLGKRCWDSPAGRSQRQEARLWIPWDSPL